MKDRRILNSDKVFRSFDLVAYSPYGHIEKTPVNIYFNGHLEFCICEKGSLMYYNVTPESTHIGIRIKNNAYNRVKKCKNV